MPLIVNMPLVNGMVFSLLAKIQRLIEYEIRRQRECEKLGDTPVFPLPVNPSDALDPVVESVLA